VKAIGARLHGYLNQAAVMSTVLRPVEAFLSVDFLDGIQGRAYVHLVVSGAALLKSHPRPVNGYQGVAGPANAEAGSVVGDHVLADEKYARDHRHQSSHSPVPHGQMLDSLILNRVT
jgi:hypothetical protein